MFQRVSRLLICSTMVFETLLGCADGEDADSGPQELEATDRAAEASPEATNPEAEQESLMPAESEPDSGGPSGGAPDDTRETDASNVQDEPAERAPLYEQLDCDLTVAVEFCGGGTCHYDTSAEFGSNLAFWNRDAQEIALGIEERLVNVPAQYHNVLNADDCPTEPELLIDPVNIEDSLLLKKLMGTQTCGDEMPKFPYPEWGAVNNVGPQREEFVRCFRDWVELLVDEYNAER